MTNQASADIIPFPLSRPIPPRPSAPAQADPAAQDRLMNAMHALQAALDEQQRAVAVWRNSLDQLKSVTGSIGRGLNRYQDRLERLQDEVGQLHTEANRLEQWADGVLTSQG